jgi:hypothetical protein
MRDYDAVVTLVHGTFAPHAPWMQEDSPFVHALGRSSNRLLVKAFTWGAGDNNIVSRMEAAEQLRAHCERVHHSYLGAPQFVVAHSHGGNVALLAANMIGSPVLLSGIACLSTPFIVARSRTIDRLAPQALHVSFYGLFGVGVYLYSQVHSFSFPIMCGILLGAGVISVLLAATIAGPMAAMASTSQKAAAIMTSALPEDMNLLIVRLSGDEASFALATGRAIWWLADRLCAAADVPENRVGWRRWVHPSPLRPSASTVWIAALGLVFLHVVIASNGSPQQPTLVDKTLLGIAMTWTLMLHTYLTAVFAAIGLALFGFANVALTLWLGTSISSDWVAIRPRVIRSIVGKFLGFIWAMMLDVSTESSPLGTWKVHQFTGGATTDQSGAGRLVHSSYDDPRVQTLVTSWIDASLEGRAGSVSHIGGHSSRQPSTT